MDFGARIPKDRKADADGHYPWESPGLRARVDEARKGAKPKEAQGLTKMTWGGSASSAGMAQRDQPKVTVLEQQKKDHEATVGKEAAEGGCRHLSTFTGVISGRRRCCECGETQ